MFISKLAAYIQRRDRLNESVQDIKRNNAQSVAEDLNLKDGEHGLQLDEQKKREMAQTQQSNADVPIKVEGYIREHNISHVVKKSLNKTLKTMPADGLSAIAGELVKAAPKSFPVFSKISARKVILGDNL